MSSNATEAPKRLPADLSEAETRQQIRQIVNELNDAPGVPADVKTLLTATFFEYFDF